MKLRTVRFALLALASFTALPAAADTMMLIRTTEDPGGGDVTRTVWVAEERFRLDSPDQSMIVEPTSGPNQCST